MSEDTKYNGWTNRATWLVNVWGNPETRSDVQGLRSMLEEQYYEMPNGILKDMLDLGEIDWEELEEACAEEEEEEESDDEDNEEADEEAEPSEDLPDTDYPGDAQRSQQEDLRLKR